MHSLLLLFNITGIRESVLVLSSAEGTTNAAGKSTVSFSAGSNIPEEMSDWSGIGMSVMLTSFKPFELAAVTSWFVMTQSFDMLFSLTNAAFDAPS